MVNEIERVPANKINKFPEDIKNEINDMFHNNHTIKDVVTFLKEKHNISVDRWTVSLYRNYYLAKDVDETELVSENDIKKAEIVINKRDLIDSLIADSKIRREELRRMNKRRFDIKWEELIIEYSEIIRKLTETSMKIKENFDSDDSQINNIAKSHLVKFMKSVYDTVKEVCPDKMLLFQKVLSEKHKENNKDEQEKKEDDNN